jgi:hypothetical protein
MRMTKPYMRYAACEQTTAKKIGISSPITSTCSRVLSLIIIAFCKALAATKPNSVGGLVFGLPIALVPHHLLKRN